MMDKITFNFRIDRETRNQFKKLAEAHGTNATTLLTQWIEDYIASNSKDSTYSKGETKESAKTNVSAETTDMEWVKNAQTEELNKLWGAINLHNKELRKLNAKMERRKEEVDAKVDYVDLVNFFQGWSVPVDQEFSLSDRISQLEANCLTNSDLKTDQQRAGQKSLDVENASLVPKSLSQSELGKRLGVTGNAVQQNRKKGEEHFKEWSRRRDPDGLAWEFDSNDGRYGKYYWLDKE